MDKLIIVANLKSHKDQNEANSWIEAFSKHKNEIGAFENKEVILCPSFPYLFSFASAFSETINIKIGAQNVSPFDEGAYTGEVNAKQIKDFAQFALVGHSERRTNFGETEDMLQKKVEMCKKYGVAPVYLIQGKDTPIPVGVDTIAYEPVFAIGSGSADTPENAQSVAEAVKERGNYSILYGGSVTSENVNKFTSGNLNGVLVGGASLDPEEFFKIIQNA